MEEEKEGNWVVRLEFNPSINEKQLWNCFESLLSSSYPSSFSSSSSSSVDSSKDFNRFPASIQVYGRRERREEGKKGKKGMAGRRGMEREEEEEDEGDVYPLFSDRFFEDIESSSSNKKRKPNNYSMVLFTTRLVNKSVHSLEDLEENDEDELEYQEIEGEEEETEEGEEGLEEGEEDQIDNSDEGIEPELITGQELSLLLDQITTLSKKISSKCEIICEESPKEAGERVERIAELLSYCDHPTILEVIWKPKDGNETQGGFKGFDIYSTLIEMGFQFDLDNNQFILDIAPLLMKKKRTDIMGKQSKKRSNEEEEEEEMNIAIIEVVAGGMEKFSLDSLSSPSSRYQSVSFEMFLPHCNFPFATIKTMIWAAIHFQTKLGGQITDYSRDPIPFSNLISEDLNVNPLGKEANELIQRIKSCNLHYGDDSLLQLFC
eukprot:TRINITY_DN1158_c0_g1_i2.p1 TRINITY_DN1158_c0_g1~~TRINITY_DN1158_c0_g1_i2.p1  ORF type:complete len:434 (+),score=215.79 TRINITY_DN1158_c0_g1_i2:18-1319(+)